MKLPVTMASCCSEASRPRIRAGEISAMYAGAITDADPAPTPRNTTSTPRLGAKPVPRALTRNSTAAIRITARRPTWSRCARRARAPAAAPRRAEATAKPREAESALNSRSTADTAPLITALS